VERSSSVGLQPLRRSCRPRIQYKAREQENPMMEMMFGAASPMWTAMPSLGLPFQPTGLAGRPMTIPPLPSLSSPGIVGGMGGPATASQALPGPCPLTSPMYAYSASGPQGAPQSLSGPTLAAVYPMPFVPSAALIGPEPLTPASLLTAVAMHRGQPRGPA